MSDWEIVQETPKKESGWEIQGAENKPTSDWSADQVKDAAINYFNLSKPKDELPPKEETWSDKFGEALKNAGKGAYVGASEAGRGIRNLPGAFYNPIAANLNLPQIPEAKEPNYQQEIGITPEQRESLSGRVGEFAGQVIPALTPGVGAAKFGSSTLEALSSIPRIGKMLGVALENPTVQMMIPQSIYSAATAPEGQRITSAEGAALLPLPLEAGLKGAGKAFDYMAGLRKNVTPEMAQQFSAARQGIAESNAATNAQKDLAESVAGSSHEDVLTKAKKLGIPMTPFEASQSPKAEMIQKTLASTPEGYDALARQVAQRTPAEKQAIDSFLSTINVSPKDSSKAIRSTAQDIIKGFEEARSESAGPHFQKAIQKNLPPSWITSLKNRDSNISNAIDTVLSDPKYQTESELLNVPENSFKVLKLAKEHIDGQIRALENVPLGEKPDTNTIRILTDSKNRLLDMMDKINKDYKIGRQEYAKGSQPVKEYKSGLIGDIAKTKDSKINTISQKIFDPKQNDLDVFRDAKDAIEAENPKIWYGIVKDELKRQLNKSGGNNAENLNKVLFNDPAMLNKFKIALENHPIALKQLNDMEQVFPKLQGKPNAPQLKKEFNLPQQEETAKNIPASKHGIIKSLINKAFPENAAATPFNEKAIQQSYNKTMSDLMTRSDWHQVMRSKVPNEMSYPTYPTPHRPTPGMSFISNQHQILKDILRKAAAQIPAKL